MTRFRIFFIGHFIVYILSTIAIAQSTKKLYGIVTDRLTKKPLFGANVIIEGTGIGDATNEQGYFEMENIFEGVYTVSAGHIGYEKIRYIDIRIPKDRPVQLYFELKPKVIPLSGVEIIAEQYVEKMDNDSWIIDSESISRSNVHNLGELIDQVPGVEIQDTGGIGGSKKISIRGSQSNQVLVLLDGVPLNDEFNGDVELVNIPTNGIEKIEIHKGGRSFKFGNGAIGGVVEITTKKSFKNQVQLNTGYGSFRSFYVEPNLSGNFKNINYYFVYNYIESDGNFPYRYTDSKGETIHENRINADMLSRNLFGRLSFLRQQHQFSVHAQRMQSLRGIPGKIDAWTAYARSNNVRDILGADYQLTTKVLNININSRYSKVATENSNLYPDDANIRYKRYPKYHYHYSINNFIVNSSVNYIPVNWYEFTAGCTFRKLTFEDKNFRAFSSSPINEADDFSRGLFLHQEMNIQLPYWQGKITVTPAIRFDEMNITSGEQNRHEYQWSPGTGLFFSIGKRYQLFLKSNIARSFRMPTFADLFYQDIRIEGKPGLLPEKGRNTEISCAWNLLVWGEFSAEVTRFDNKIEDLIVWRLGSYEVFRPFNNDAEIKGLEYLLKFYTPNDLIKLELSYIDLKPLNKNKHQTTYNKIIPYRPQSSFKGSLGIQVNGISLSVHYRDVGKRYINEANTKTLPQYQVFDFNLHWTKFFGPIEVSWKLSAYNVFNEEYEIIRDMPLPPREWRFGISLTY